jgi:AcrR family transcriptional regulator
MSQAAIARPGVDERRRRLLEVGLELFSGRSYDDVSIDDIAAAAGISKGLLYHYFRSKRDFYVAGLRVAAEDMRARTEPDPELPAHERLRAGLDSYLEFVERYDVAYASLLRGGVGSDPEVATIVEESRTTVIDRVLEPLEGTPPDPLLRLALRGWIGYVEGASLDWLDRRDADRETLRELLMRALAAAVLASAELSPDPQAPAHVLLEELARGAP